MSTSIRELTNLLSCPISHELMEDPVIIQCGHTFDREYLVTWIRYQQNQRQPALCPLDKTRPVSEDTLLPNFLAKHAIELLRSEDIQRQVALVQELEDLSLTDEDRHDFGQLIQTIKERRARDQGQGIPSFVEPSLSQKIHNMMRKIKESSRQVFGSKKEGVRQ